ncbi:MULTISPECIES: efflux RND transporter periplasmic adaptor subunit [Myroides]|uniref:Efflux RND transporter periplasmic adaptor subunit n=1 Tax=Myroides albus TaxID=2562892 RepID=A0A6I3LKS8_9FLAO|nr:MULTISPECIES: efflux RND transporter periplasmic adaptor subunit [Myroides]MTG96625.1 efflux RND transporter periplasmic adaptor subunit [Myroides albus]MVX35256.1 efflux RND transporter periplasmic adaptor subunit [Myroides sp. LoEW2-1]
MAKKVQIAGVLGLSLLLSFCSDKNEQNGETAQYLVENKVISLTENSNLKSRIKTTSVSEEDFTFDLVTAGIVKAIPNHYAEIASPFSGRIIKSFVKLGQKVAVNTPLFEVTSPDYFDAQKDYFDSKQEYKQASLNLRRQADLLENGVGVRQEYEEAETENSIAKAAFDNATAAIKIYNVEPTSLVLGQPLIVRSPIAGEVLENNVVIGQYINDDSEPVVKIASLNKIWIVGKIKEKDINHLNKLNKVQVELSAYLDQPIVGTIYHINEIVDEETRSIDVLIEVENDKRILKPGMYVNVRFIDQPEKVILVPSRSILQGEDDSFVFVAVSEHSYVRKNVKIGGVSGDKTVILSGLDKGDKVVSEGGIYLPQL